MTTFIHHRRYGKPRGDEIADVAVDGDGVVWYAGRRWNLRDGSKSGFVEGFKPSLDGRYLRYSADNKVEAVRGKTTVDLGLDRAPIAPQWVGKYLVADIDYSATYTVIDTETGKHLGTIENDQGEIPAIANPYDETTLWLGSEKQLVQFDVAKRKAVRTIPATSGWEFRGLGALPGGFVAAHQANGTKSRVIAFGPTGQLGTFELAPDGMAAITGLGAVRYVITDFANKRFVVTDRNLSPLGEVAMFEPEKRTFSRVTTLLNGREWISVGGRGEWDHYGEPGVTKAAKMLAAVKKPAVVKKPAAKKPASSGRRRT